MGVVKDVEQKSKAWGLHGSWWLIGFVIALPTAMLVLLLCWVPILGDGNHLERCPAPPSPAYTHVVHRICPGAQIDMDGILRLRDQWADEGWTVYADSVTTTLDCRTQAPPGVVQWRSYGDGTWKTPGLEQRVVGSTEIGGAFVRWDSHGRVDAMDVWLPSEYDVDARWMRHEGGHPLALIALPYPDDEDPNSGHATGPSRLMYGGDEELTGVGAIPKAGDCVPWGSDR